MTPLFAHIHHVRAGFATNCSSSHSLIYLPGTEDDLSEIEPPVYDYDFVLASREAKLPYVRIQLERAEAFDAQLREELGEAAPNGELDYYSWAGSPELVRQIARWALKEGVVVLGGPDNAEHHALSGKDAIDPSEFWSGMRWDPLGFWTHITGWGDKLRVSFSRAAHPRVRPFRSTLPEMVDLKITDRCRQQCEFCYQDSRPEGAHATTTDVLAILDDLARAQVMEVVLGGGEPTEHPRFAQLLAAIQKRKMHAAFTTRRLDWYEQCQKQLASSEVDYHDVNWAYSLSSIEDCDQLASLWKRRTFPSRPALHIVLGTELSRPESLRQIAARCKAENWRLVLLGYKRVGRAESLEPVPYDHWIDTVSSSGLQRVAIDAVLAREFELELHRRGVPEWLLETEDGRFSMYVDAVSMRCGPSSHCGDDAMRPVDLGGDSVQRAFDEINRRLGPARIQQALELEQLGAQMRGDKERLVLLDAAMDGRCELCGGERAAVRDAGIDRPRVLCDACAAGGAGAERAQ